MSRPVGADPLQRAALSSHSKRPDVALYFALNDHRPAIEAAFAKACGNASTAPSTDKYSSFHPSFSSATVLSQGKGSFTVRVDCAMHDTLGYAFDAEGPRASVDLTIKSAVRFPVGLKWASLESFQTAADRSYRLLPTMQRPSSDGGALHEYASDIFALLQRCGR